VLVLSADEPALFVTVTASTPGYFSDNALTLLPGREVRLTFTPRKGAVVSRTALAESLGVGHLRQTY
jgi:beta-mannosidase